MASLDRNLRRDLENAVRKARRVAEAGARDAINQLGVGHHEPWSALSPEQRKLRNRLRAHGRQLGDKLDEKKGTQTIDRLTGECAYEHWHRLLFARFLAENDLLVEPDSGMALSLDECRELAREQGKDWLVLASDFAQRMLPHIFRTGDPVLEIALPPEKRQELEAILEGLPHEVFIADDSLGWVYQYWQADQKDAINASETKIGADELPAVTQLFTEDYMVLFLLHNALGAWWAGKVLAQRPDLARSSASEDECRAACAVQGIEWSYLRFVREDDVWRPAAGTFLGWPTAAKGLTVLDPCMGSGHFLAFALPMLVALRREEEKLSVSDAVDAVLRDNVFGLELDPRCTQIAAFNVGLTAWKLAGYRSLPALNLACSGLAINASLVEWTAVAAGDAPAENAMTQLYELFRQAPTLGSLVDPTRVGGELFVAGCDKVARMLTQALARERGDERVELAVAAAGIAGAANLLSRRYSLVITNVPYLTRGKQQDMLKDYCEDHYPEAKDNLANVFLERCLELSLDHDVGVVQVVIPQNWLFTNSYKQHRESLLKRVQFNLVTLLGAKGFQTPMWDFNVQLLTVSKARAPEGFQLRGVDASAPKVAQDKAQWLRDGEVRSISQSRQLRNPDAVVSLVPIDSEGLLSSHVSYSNGIQAGDAPRFTAHFWEVLDERVWSRMQTPISASTDFDGLDTVFRWEDGGGTYWRYVTERLGDGSQRAWVRGVEFRGRAGVAISATGRISTCLYSGELWNDSLLVLVPDSTDKVAAILLFCSSGEFEELVRKLDQKLNVRSAVTKVPFDLARWHQVAAERYPNGLPKPFSHNPTQWLFHGHPQPVADPLHVAIARMCGYRWPAEADASIELADEARFWITRCDGLAKHADADGIVCLPSLRGEASAEERVRALLADAFGAEWTAQKLNNLVANAGFAGKSLDEWVRGAFFEQHCTLFQQRPFVWQIWDGRKDGFSALVNYHKLAAPNGEGRRILDKLTHTYLGDWLDRQRADQKAGVEGADGRVASAEHLKRELERIIEGEPPYDIFVRWKPLHQQPVGWEPDIDDGVRVNIRPFMTAKPLNARGKNACILRVAPKIKWDKDRGKEPKREKADFPWFWGWDGSTEDFTGGKEFDGNRWNDLHYSRAAKLAARERAKGGR